MKTALFGLALAVFAPMSATANPQPSSRATTSATYGTGTTNESCSSIGDSDDRQLCHAREKKDANACSSIRDDDKRTFCKAVVTGQSNTCSGIRNDDLRNRCKSETK